VGSGWWTAPNPSLELDLDGLRRRRPLPLAVLELMDSRIGRAQNEKKLERYEETLTAQVKQPFYQQALEYHAELEQSAGDWLDRARVRAAVADYIEGTAYSITETDFAAVEERREYMRIMQKLRDARQFATWGVDPMDERPVVDWFGRAGLVKLCPDDARKEAERIGALYGERLEACDALGYVLRYAVFSLPNFPQWHLAAGIDASIDRFKREILYARTDGRLARNINDPKRRFPDLLGALFCLEAPLSGLYRTDPGNAWNVHLNVLLVFRKSKDQPYGRPDYAPLREAWGADVEFRTIPQGDKDAMRAAIREVVKYPLQSIAEKSAKHRRVKRDRYGRPLPPAPPLIEWPHACFREWWRAHKGFRRTRSYGVLYDSRFALEDGDVIELTAPPRRNLDLVDWVAPIWLTTARCTIARPMPDTRELDERQLARQRAELRERKQAAADQWFQRFDLIQGNKSAADRTATVIGALARAGPDPPC
jgi:hypothetical protein